MSCRSSLEKPMKETYDILVIGAGPAGALAAETAADAGCSVLLLEKRSAIGTPLRCAEGIMKADLEEFIEPDSAWISAVIKREIIVAPDGRQITITSKDIAGYTLDRKRFDRALVWNAIDAGAKVEVKSLAKPFLENGKIVGAIVTQNGITRISERVSLLLLMAWNHNSPSRQESIPLCICQRLQHAWNILLPASTLRKIPISSISHMLLLRPVICGFFRKERTVQISVSAFVAIILVMGIGQKITWMHLFRNSIRMAEFLRSFLAVFRSPDRWRRPMPIISLLQEMPPIFLMQ